MVAHTVGYLAAVFLVLSPGIAVLFVVVHLALWGVYMGCSFAPNHKGMPTMTGESPDFLRKQVLTSRNVRGGWFTDFLLGGLNYQIEHHLFPACPGRLAARAAHRAAVLRRARNLLQRDRSGAVLPRSVAAPARNGRAAAGRDRVVSVVPGLPGTTPAVFRPGTGAPT